MAAYNAEMYVEAAINSLTKQSFENWELIVVNDGSTDSTPLIVARHAAADKRIVVIHQSNSGCAGIARNKALKYTSGRYCQMLDSDDLFDDDFLKKQYELIKKTDADTIIPILKSFKQNIGNIVCEWNGVKGNRDITLNGDDGYYYSIDWTIHGCFTIRSEILKRIGYENELINGDEFTTRKLLYNSKKIVFSDSIYYYRSHEISTTKSKKNQTKMFQCLLTDLNIYKYSVDKNMSNKTIHSCSNKLLYSLLFHQISYFKNHKNWVTNEDEQVKNILRKVYKDINFKQLLHSNPIYSFFYMLTFHSYSIFKSYISILVTIRYTFNVK